MDDSCIHSRTPSSAVLRQRPQTALPSSHGPDREQWRAAEDYMSNRASVTPAGMLRPATAHPTSSNKPWQQVADLLRHKGYVSARLPQLGALNKGTVCLKEPNSLPATALQPNRSDGGDMPALPPLHTPLATTWIKGHLQVVTGHRNQLEDELKSLKHDTRVTRMQHLEQEVGVLQAQLHHPPQAFQIMKRELEDSQRTNQQLQKDYLALKQSVRTTRIAELESEIDILKTEVLRLMKLLKYAQHLGSDVEALELEITTQVKAKLQRQLDASSEKARAAEHRAKAAGRKLQEALERERALQGQLAALQAAPPADPGLEQRLREEMEARFREEMEARMRDVAVENEKLAVETRQQLELQLRQELEAALRPELEQQLRAQLRAELEPLLRQEIEAELRAEFEARLSGMEATLSDGAAQQQLLLQERDKQLADAGMHAQKSLQALVGYLRTRELPEDAELQELQRAMRFDAALSADKAADAVPALKVAHRVVMSQVCKVRDMLVRYKVLTEMTDLEEMFQHTQQHPATSGLPDVLRQLLALLAALVQDMRSLPGLPGSIVASMILGDGSGGASAVSPQVQVVVARSVCGVQDLLVLLQDQRDLLRRQQPQGALVTLHADSMRQLASICQILVSDVSQVYGQANANAAVEATASVIFVASSDMWARMPAADAARLLHSAGHRVAGWLLRNGLEELAVPLCGGSLRVAWLDELQQLDAGAGGLERLLQEQRPEPAAPMQVSRLLALLQQEAAIAAAAAGDAAAAAGSGDDGQLADEEAMEAGKPSVPAPTLPESEPLPLREAEGSWARRLLREDIHVTMERYGLFRWAECLWQFGVRTAQHLADAAKDCSAEVQSLASAMCDLERARFARLIRNSLRAAATSVPDTPPPAPAAPARDLTAAQALGQELLAAAQGGDALACEELLVTRGARPELAVDAATGRTALIAAAEGGFVDVVTLLLFHNADASVRDRAGRTALLVAARNMRSAACEQLLLSGKLEVLSSVDVQDDSGTSAVVYACRNCMKDVAVKLVMVGANPDAAQPDADKNGFGQQVRRATLDGAFLRQELFLGAEDGDVARCQRAIDGLPCGPNVKPRDDGFTPLHAAVLNGNEAVVKLLLARGATPDARYARKTPLVCAAVLGNASMCRMLAANGVDVKRGGYEALMEACQHRQGAACLALLELGTPPAPASTSGGPAPRSFPLSVAAFNGMPDVVKALLERGVPVDVEVRSSPSTLSTAPGGFTALSCACSGSMYEAGTLAVAQLLLKQRADVNAAAADGATPLMFAAFAHGGDMVRLLLAAGARPAVRGGRKARSALMLAAARRGDRGLSAAEALLRAAADAREIADLCLAKDEDGRSAYDHALSSGSSGVAHLLEEYNNRTSAVTGAVFRTYTGATVGSAGSASGSILKSQLRQAVSAGDVDGCRRVLDSADRSWAPDDAVDGSGRTPLHLAVVSGSPQRLQLARLLLDGRSDANRMYDYDSCALRDAALRGDVDMVRLLLPWSTAEVVRRLALQSAIYKRQEPVALELMAAYAAGGKGAVSGGWGTLLHEAAEHGLEQVCVKLMDQGAEASKLVPSPALRVVANRGEAAGVLCVVAAAVPATAARLCELLLARRVDVDAATEVTGATALMFAAAAARHNGARAAEVVQLLLDNGADQSAQGGVSHRTPLMWAAMAEADCGLGVVRALLAAAEASPTDELQQLLTAVDDAGDTAVMLAVGSRSEEVEQAIRDVAASRGFELPAAPVKH